MVPLAAHRRVWTWIGLCSFDENPSKWKNMLYFMLNMILSTSFVGAIFASGAFVMAFLPTDLEGSLHALFQVTAYTGLVYVVIVAFIVRHKITDIFSKLTEIYEQSKSLILMKC